MFKKQNIKLIFLSILALPFLLSFDPLIYHSNYLAKYTSPEGIHFLSYSMEWDEHDLQELYHELLRNKHGEELLLLQEVRVIGEKKQSSHDIRGQYFPLINSITIYQGDKYTSPSQVRETLSHEYGHHFAYHYFPSHHFPFSKWAKLRGLENEPVQWNSFFNYTIGSHEWIPQEIFADDYVLLFGSSQHIAENEVYSNEAFYTRTEHENQQIDNILGNEELIEYIENKSNIQFDDHRLIKTPMIIETNNESISYSISDKANIAYRLNLTFYEKLDETLVEIESYEKIQITNADTGNILTFSFDGIIPKSTNSTYFTANLDIVDLTTSIGFQTDSIRQ